MGEEADRTDRRGCLSVIDIALLSITPDIRTLGALNVSTYLRHNGYSNSFVYYLTPYRGGLPDQMRSRVISFLKDLNPQVIGISLTTYFFDVARELTAQIKKEMPSALVVWGGTHPTVKPDECIAHCDVVCVGEGEEALLDLVRRLDNGRPFLDIENMWVNHNGVTYRNQVRSLCENLDTRPFPAIDWDSTFVLDGQNVVPLTHELYDKYRPKQSTVYEVMATRGCPFSCSYCCNSTFRRLYKGKGRMVRFRSVDHVMQELRYVKATFPKVKAINFEDDALGIAADEYLVALCEAYKRQIGLPFHMRVVPHVVTERKIEILKRGGLVGAVMGLQASDRMNKEIYNRPVSQQQFIEAARLLHKHKVIGRYDVIIDNPYSCEEDEVEAIRTFMEVPKPYQLYVYSLAFLPGTDLTKRAKRDGKYDPASAGYDCVYGKGDHLFPSLVLILGMTPFTPRFVISMFLAIRRFRVGERIIALYYRLVFGCERIVIDWSMRNAGRLLFLRKLLLGRK